jgi:hypothetical protein
MQFASQELWHQLSPSINIQGQLSGMLAIVSSLAKSN